MNYCFFEAPFGTLRIVENNGFLVQITRSEEPLADGREQETSVLTMACEQLAQYFAGERREFQLPLYTEGTSFQKKAWDTLLTIPYGETISYGQEARQMDCTCARAVGLANGKNPIIIVIPCHRVIRSDGTLGGYTGGLDIKEYLLQHEQKYKKQE